MIQRSILLLVLGIICAAHGQRQYLRAVKPTTSVRTRPQRQTYAAGYQNHVLQQHAAAVASVDEATQGVEATQFAVDYLQATHPLQVPLQLTQQTEQVASATPIQTQNPVYIQSGIIYTDQFGHLVQGPPQAQVSSVQVQPPQTGIVRLVDQYGNIVGHQHHHLQVNAAVTATQSEAQPQPANGDQGEAKSVRVTNSVPEVSQPQPVYHQAQAPDLQQYLHHHVPAQPIYQQIMTAHGPVLHQIIQQPQPIYQHQVVHEQPLLQHHHHAIPQVLAPTIHEHVDHAHPVVHFHQPHILAPEPVVPIVKEVIQPAIIHKEIVTPAVKLIKQPIHPPAIFQKEIFAVKNPPLRVLTYSDLCTVYPYQRKLAGCVYKKAAIPEFHHPDIQLVHEDNGNGRSDSNSNSNKPTSLSSSRRTDRDQSDEGERSAENIQDLLPNEEEQHDRDDANLNEDKANVAESSNKKEKIVIKTTKPKKSSTTTTTTPSSTTTKKPKSKRRSKNSKRRSERRQSKNNSTSTTTTSARPFKLA